MELRTEYYKNRLQEFSTFVRSSKSTRLGEHDTGAIKHFLVYLESRSILNLNEISEYNMIEYFEYLKDRPKQRGEGKLNIATVNSNLSSIRLFSTRMLDGKEIKKSLSVPRNVRVEREGKNYFTSTRSVLTVEEKDELLNACESSLERALIALAYGCGMRRSELVNLKDNKIDYATGIITIERSKGNKTREVQANRDFLEALTIFGVERMNRLARSENRCSFYFINENGSRMQGEHLNKLLKKIIQRTRSNTIIEKGITLHCLRHSIATHKVNEGKENLDEVRMFLGHSMLDTTAIYARRKTMKFTV